MKRVLFTLFITCLLLGKSFGQAVPNFTFNVACKGDTTTLVSTSSATLPHFITSISWDLNGDFTFGDAFGETVKVHWPVPGNYDVGLRVYTNLGAMESVYKQVPVSDVSAGFSSQNYCLGDITQFFNESTTFNCAIDKYEWSFGTTYLSNLENPVYEYPSVGSYNVSLTVTTDNGCKDTRSDIVIIRDVPDISLSYSMEPTSISNEIPTFIFYEGQTLTATVYITNAFSDIIWSNNAHTASITVTEEGYYTVEVVNEFGCSSSLGFNVKVKPDNTIIPLPLITPNDDGINDAFIVKQNRAPGDQFELIVYNRYGDEVYSSSNYQNDWKGTYEGKRLPDGSYYYHVTNKRDNRVYKGALSILTNEE